MPAGAAGADSEAPRQPLPRGLTGFSTTGSYTHASDSGGLPQPFKQGLVTGSGSLWDLQDPPSLVNKLASRTWLPLDLVEGWEGDEEEAGHSGQPREKPPNSQSVLSLDKFERVSYYSRLGVSEGRRAPIPRGMWACVGVALCEAGGSILAGTCVAALA